MRYYTWNRFCIKLTSTHGPFAQCSNNPQCNGLVNRKNGKQQFLQHYYITFLSKAHFNDDSPKLLFWK